MTYTEMEATLAAGAPKLELSDAQTNDLFNQRLSKMKRDGAPFHYELSEAEKVDVLLEFHARNSVHYAKKIVEMLYPQRNQR